MDFVFGSLWEKPLASILAIFRDFSDPRSGNATRHDLLDVLVIALTASICGCESCVDFADFAGFAEDREELFREFLSLENGLPSHDTFLRLFRMLDPAALSRCFLRFLEDLGADGPGLIAIDGKTLRRSFDRAAGKSALHVVTAFAGQAGLVLGQKAVPEGGNEITAQGRCSNRSISRASSSRPTRSIASARRPGS